MKKMNPIVHFEMPAEDRVRMAGFYNNVFGWKTEMLGPEMGDYVLVTTSDVDPNGRKENEGMIGGGFYPKREDSFPYPTFVIGVDNIQESMKDIAKAGGKIIGEPMEIPGVGLFVSFNDTENNRVSLLQSFTGRS